DAQWCALLQQGVNGGPADPKSLGDFGDAQQRSDGAGNVGVWLWVHLTTPWCLWVSVMPPTLRTETDERLTRKLTGKLTSSFHANWLRSDIASADAFD